MTWETITLLFVAGLSAGFIDGGPYHGRLLTILCGLDW